MKVNPRCPRIRLPQAVLDAFKTMPPLCHNPRKGSGLPFDIGLSESARWLANCLAADPDFKQSLHNVASSAGLIAYSPAENAWKGANHDPDNH